MHEKLDLLLKQTSCDTNGNGSRMAKEKTTSNEEVDPKKDVVDEVTQTASQNYTPHVIKFSQENEIEGKYLENLLDCIPHWFGIAKGKRKRKKAASCLEPFVEPTAQRKKLKEKEDSYDLDEEHPHDDLMKIKCWFSSKDDAIVDLNYALETAHSLGYCGQKTIGWTTKSKIAIDDTFFRYMDESFCSQNPLISFKEADKGRLLNVHSHAFRMMKMMLVAGCSPYLEEEWMEIWKGRWREEESGGKLAHPYSHLDLYTQEGRQICDKRLSLNSNRNGYVADRSPVSTDACDKLAIALSCRTKLTMSLEGIDEGWGWAFMKEREVLGGSMLGISFFHASTNVDSMDCSAGRLLEKARTEVLIVTAAVAEQGRRLREALL
ncbi:hypothetical protein Scep_014194 [Stephania cephalantha]|uniref:Uncharacterized protein n=1 Tax=Stephania cephalantha TaxID=152367 RepID=A0AAP0P045_9MAGN